MRSVVVSCAIRRSGRERETQRGDPCDCINLATHESFDMKRNGGMGESDDAMTVGEALVLHQGSTDR